MKPEPFKPTRLVKQQQVPARQGTADVQLKEIAERLAAHGYTGFETNCGLPLDGQDQRLALKYFSDLGRDRSCDAGKFPLEVSRKNYDIKGTSYHEVAVMLLDYSHNQGVSVSQVSLIRMYDSLDYAAVHVALNSGELVPFDWVKVKLSQTDDLRRKKGEQVMEKCFEINTNPALKKRNGMGR